jgi:hypothetical protein
MAGEKAALVATDPPYLVDYTGERPNDSGKDWTDRYREIDIQDADGFFRAVFVNVLDVLGPKGALLLLARTQAVRRHPADLARARHLGPPADHLDQTDPGVRARLLALPARALASAYRPTANLWPSSIRVHSAKWWIGEHSWSIAVRPEPISTPWKRDPVRRAFPTASTSFSSATHSPSETSSTSALRHRS